MTTPRDESDLVLYQTDDGITRLHVRLVEASWLASACPGSSTTYTWIVVREPRLLLDRAEHRSVRRESTPLLRQATCPLVVSVEDGV